MNKQTFLTLLATFALLFSFTFSCHAKGKDKAKHVVSSVWTAGEPTAFPKQICRT